MFEPGILQLIHTRIGTRAWRRSGCGWRGAGTQVLDAAIGVASHDVPGGGLRHAEVVQVVAGILSGRSQRTL